MKRFLPFLVAVFVLGTISPAFAKKQFSDIWLEKYAKDEKNKDFNAKVAEAKCNVCHQGTAKKDRNEYGVEIGKILKWKDFGNNGDRFTTDAEAAKKEVLEAFKKVEEIKAKNGELFGKRIKDGNLPGVDPSEKK